MGTKGRKYFRLMGGTRELVDIMITFLRSFRGRKGKRTSELVTQVDDLAIVTDSVRWEEHLLLSALPASLSP